MAEEDERVSRLRDLAGHKVHDRFASHLQGCGRSSADPQSDGRLGGRAFRRHARDEAGITEREISALMQYEFGKRGCERPAYAPIVGSGYYSTVLHYSEDSATMKAGDVVVIDVVGSTRCMPPTSRARFRSAANSARGNEKSMTSCWRAAGGDRCFSAGQVDLEARGRELTVQSCYDYINSHGKICTASHWATISFTASATTWD